MKRFAIDCSFLVLNRASGLKTYTWNLVSEMLPLLSPEERLVAFYHYFRSPCPVPEIPGIQQRTCRWPRRILEALWGRVSFPPIEWWTGRVDCYHSVHCYLPPTWSAPRLLTIHDLRDHVLPDLFPELQETARRRRVMARAAECVITISEHTRQEAIEFLKVPPDRIRVIPNGLNLEFATPIPATVEEATLLARDLNRPFVLFLNSLDPRKGIEQALRSFEIALDEGLRDVELVIAGETSERHRVLVRESRYSSRIRVLGVVTQLELRVLLRRCLALLFLSRYEGFGLPILEAFASETPVIAYANSAIPEVAGDAALLVPNLQPEAAAHSLLRLLDDQQLQQSLKMKGAARYPEFSWRRSAQSLLDVYRELARS